MNHPLERVLFEQKLSTRNGFECHNYILNFKTINNTPFCNSFITTKSLKIIAFLFVLDSSVQWGWWKRRKKGSLCSPRWRMGLGGHDMCLYLLLGIGWYLLCFWSFHGNNETRFQCWQCNNVCSWICSVWSNSTCGSLCCSSD